MRMADRRCGSLSRVRSSANGNLLTRTPALSAFFLSPSLFLYVWCFSIQLVDGGMEVEVLLRRMEELQQQVEEECSQEELGRASCRERV